MVGWLHQLNGLEFEQTPGDGEGPGSLVCCNPLAHKESDATEWLNNNKNMRGIKWTHFHCSAMIRVLRCRSQPHGWMQRQFLARHEDSLCLFLTYKRPSPWGKHSSHFCGHWWVLPALIFCKWNHTTCTLCFWVFFLRVCEICLCCYLHLCSLLSLFLCPILLHLSTTVYLSVLLVDGHPDCFQFMTTINRSVVNLSLLWWVSVYLFLLICKLVSVFSDRSVGKESACSAGGDPGSIPGLRRSAREGIGYPLQYSWASLGAQLVKNQRK